jgi:NDP-sugar pyrophosphorylase family protein
MFSTDIGNPEDYENIKEYLEDKKWFDAKLKKKHTKKTLNDGTQSYAFELGNVWIGENKKDE